MTGAGHVRAMQKMSCLSADTRNRVADRRFDEPLSADGGAHDHVRAFDDLADDRGVTPVGVAPERREDGLRIMGGRDPPSRPCPRSPPRGGGRGRASRRRSGRLPGRESLLLDDDADAALSRHLVDGVCKPASCRVFHGVDVPPAASAFSTSGQRGATSDLIWPPKSNPPSRWAMMAMPWSPMVPLTMIVSPG